MSVSPALVLYVMDILPPRFWETINNEYIYIKILNEMRKFFSFFITVPLLLISQDGICQPEVVDLGLSVKWASCNLGATAPEEYGDYFAWGEVETYYVSDNVQDDSCNGWKSDKSTGYGWTSYKWSDDSGTTFTKYNTDLCYGDVDNNTVLDPEDDAASVSLGGSWRMPTDAEWSELRGRCTWRWTTRDGKEGYMVTGPNGNGIFLPAAGYQYNTRLCDTGINGEYWSSTLRTDRNGFAWGVCFDSDNILKSGYNRYIGFPIRAVTK